MGRLMTTTARQAKHDRAVLRDLALCRDDKGRLDLSVLPPGRRARLKRHLQDVAMQMARRVSETQEKAR